MVLISYSRADSAYADQLDTMLIQQGYKTWIDRNEILGTEQWRNEIPVAINNSTVVAFLVSEQSVASEIVQQEIRWAIDKKIPVLQIILNEAILPTDIEFSLIGQQRVKYSEPEMILRSVKNIFDPAIQAPPRFEKLSFQDRQIVINSLPKIELGRIRDNIAGNNISDHRQGKNIYLRNKGGAAINLKVTPANDSKDNVSCEFSKSKMDTNTNIDIEAIFKRGTLSESRGPYNLILTYSDNFGYGYQLKLNLSSSRNHYTIGEE